MLRNIHLQKKRTVAVAISLNNDVWARSYVEGCKIPPQENITLDTFYIENGVDALLDSNYPCNGITVANTNLGDAKLCFRAENFEELTYPIADLTLKNVTLTENSVVFDEKHRINIKRAE